MSAHVPPAVRTLRKTFHRCVMGPQDGTVHRSGEPRKHRRPALPGEPAGSYPGDYFDMLSFFIMPSSFFIMPSSFFMPSLDMVSFFMLSLDMLSFFIPSSFFIES